MDDIKLCKDCKYFESLMFPNRMDARLAGGCKKLSKPPTIDEYDYVLGQHEFLDDRVSCYDARYNGNCGIDGKLFEPINNG